MNVLIPFATNGNTEDEGLVEYASCIEQIKNIYNKYDIDLLLNDYIYTDIRIGENDDKFVKIINSNVFTENKYNISIEDYCVFSKSLNKINLYGNWFEGLRRNCPYGDTVYGTIDEFKDNFGKQGLKLQTIKHINKYKYSKYHITGKGNCIIAKPDRILITSDSLILTVRIKFPKDFILDCYSEKYNCYIRTINYNSSKVSIKSKNGNISRYTYINNPMDMGTLEIPIHVLNASILTYNII